MHPVVKVSLYLFTIYLAMKVYLGVEKFLQVRVAAYFITHPVSFVTGPYPIDYFLLFIWELLPFVAVIYLGVKLYKIVTQKVESSIKYLLVTSKYLLTLSQERS